MGFPVGLQPLCVALTEPTPVTWLDQDLKQKPAMGPKVWHILSTNVFFLSTARCGEDHLACKGTFDTFSHFISGSELNQGAFRTWLTFVAIEFELFCYAPQHSIFLVKVIKCEPVADSSSSKLHEGLSEYGFYVSLLLQIEFSFYLWSCESVGMD